MKQSKWDLDEAEAMFWIAIEAGYSFMGGMKKVYGFGLSRNAVIFYDNGLFKWYTLTQELINIGNKCLEKFKDKDFRNKIINNFKEIKSQINDKIKEYQSKNKTKLSTDELFDYLTAFTLLYRRNFDNGFFAEPYDFVFGDEFKKVLKKYNLSQEEFISVSAIPDTSYLNIEEQKLIKLAIKQKNNKDIEEDLKQHLKEFEWMATGHAGKKQIDIDYFKKRINELMKKELDKELKHLQEFEKETTKKKQELIEKYNFNENALLMIEISDSIGPLRDIRKEHFVKCIYYSDDIREELGRRFNYTLKELQTLELKELLPLKEGKELDKKEIQKRLEFTFLDVKNNKYKVYSGKESMKLTKEFEEEHEDIDKLEGTCASVGKVQGKVKIVFGEKGFDKMNKGDILVTGMTRPEMLPVMKKAGAIVTDEGGITCHAAIVARELKIPCVIATRIGTKVFKDDDLVEVDADKGIVKKLN